MREINKQKEKYSLLRETKNNWEKVQKEKKKKGIF